MRAFHPLQVARALAAVLLLALLGTVSAGAAVLVNKAFSPTSVQLGVTSNVTITLSNTSTLTAATITSFSDDVATMLGKASIATQNNLATTCGATPAIAGSVVSMNAGTIPVAADSTHPGTCTITFTVVGAAVGNGINSIAAGALVTDQGSNATAASQTLQVQSAVLGVSTGVTVLLLTSATATQSYTITNPTAAAITNTTFPITITTGSSAVTVSGGSTGACTGSITPATASASSVTQTVAGLTIPANGSCTISFSLTDPTIATGYTATGVLNASAINDDQGISNSTAITNKSQFITGRVTFSKAFTPNIITRPGTSRLAITMANTQTIPLTSVAFSDPLPTFLTLDAVPAAAFSSGCTTIPTVAGAGTATITVSGATIGAATTLGTATTASTCTVTVTVDASAGAFGTITNTIPAVSLTNTEGVSANGAASANLSISAGALNGAKTFSASSVARNVPVTETLSFSNGSGTALTAGTFTDNLPQTSTTVQPLSMQYFTGFTPTFTGCTGVVTPSAGNTVVTGTGLSIAAGSSCVVKFQVVLTGGAFPAQSDLNTIPTPNVSFTDSTAVVIHPTAALSATLSTAPAFTVKTFTASAAGLANQPLTVSSQVIYGPAVTVVDTDTNAVATFVLNAGATHNVMLAPVPNFQFSGCPAGTSAANVTQMTGGATVTSGGESFSVAFPAAIGATCTVTYSIVNKNTIGGASATYSPGISTYTSTEQSGTSTTAGNGSVTFYTTSLLINKQFTPISIAAGGTATAQFTLDVANVPALATTQANGVTFVDNLPANMAFAAAPAVTFSAGCTQGGQPAAASAIAGTSITFSNISLLSTSAAQTDCTITFAVTSNFLGNTTNTIPASGVASTSGATNTQTASASLTVVAGVALQKTFLNSAFAIGDVNYVRFLILNSSGGVLSSGTLTDVMPTSLALSSLTAQPAAQGGDPVSCGGTVSGTLGSNTFSLAGMSVAGALGPSMPGQCVQYVQVKASTTAAPGNVVNTIPAGALSIGGQTNLTGTSTPPENITGAPNAAVTQAFAPAAIVQHGVSQLTITFANTGSLAAPLSAVALTDTLPAGVTVAATPGAATTCTGGSVSATAGATSVALTGGTLAANASCTLVVNVTGAVANSYTNTIGAGALTTTQGATNVLSTAVLTVTAAPNVTLGLAFVPASIVPNALSVVTISVANTAAGSLALSSLTLSDVLPSGITIAAIPTASTTCGAGTVTAPAGGTTIALAAGTLGAGLTCTVTVNVNGTLAAVYSTTIAIANVTSYEGATNAAPATGSLTIVAPAAVGLAKAFAPASIAPGATSVLTITLANTGAGAGALTNVALSDTLPAGVVVAAVPGASTTCPSGSVAAAGGALSVALSGATLAAAASCTIVVNVTATTPNAYTNTIAAGALTSAQMATNASAAVATLTIAASAPVLSSAFVAATIVSGTTSVLTVTIANTGSNAVALSAIALSDTLPAGVTIAATPNAATTCGSGVAAAAAGGSTLALSGATLAAGATCTFSATVTSSAVASYSATIAAGALTDLQALTNAAPTTATLNVVVFSPVGVAKSFAPGSIVTGQTSVLTVTLANTGGSAVALTNAALSDALPAGMVVAAIPAATTTCASGTVTAVAGSSSVALANAALAAGATCTFTATVTSASPGALTNSIAPAVLTDTQGVGGASTATATLTVASATTLSLTKAFVPASVAAGSPAVLTVTIANAAPGAPALTGMAFTDPYPAGLVNAATPGAVTTCGAGTVAATAGGANVALTNGTLAAGASCTVSVSVRAPVGTYANSIAALTTTQGLTNATPATATFAVVAMSPVTIAKSFAPAAIAAGQSSVLTVSLANTGSAAIALTNVSVLDALPAGMTVATVPGATTTCALGTVTAVGAGASVALGNAALAAGATCTFSASVTSSSPGVLTNAIAPAAFTNAQAVPSAATATAALTVNAATTVTVAKAFAPATIVSGGTSVLTTTLLNTASGAIGLTALALSDALPAGVVVAGVPNASTTCGAGVVTGAAGAAAVGLTGGSLAAGAACTISVTVTGAIPGSYVAQTLAGAVTDAQNVANPVAASASLAVTAAQALTLTQSFAQATIAAGMTSVLTVTLTNGAAGATALSGVAFTDALPAGVVLAAIPNATTTCASGAISAPAGGTTFALGSAALAANATCTVSVTVSAVAAGAYTNAIGAGAVTSTQGSTNTTATQAVLTAVVPTLVVTKSADVAGADVSAGQPILYTIAVRNTSAIAQTNAKLSDVLVNAALVPGSVTVNGVAGADSIIASGSPFGSIAPGATATIVYSATVNATVVNGAVVTNTVTASGDQGCAGSPCAASSLPDTVRPPSIAVTLLIDGQVSETVLLGQIVTYSALVKNTGGSIAQNVTFTDVLPAGVTPIPGSVTTPAVPQGATRRGTLSANAVNGQTVTAALGSLAPGATAAVVFQATITAPIPGVVANTVTVGATGIDSFVSSNTVVAQMIRSLLNVTKASSATVVRVGDRVNYTVTVGAPAGMAFGQTTIVDVLPAFMLYAPGTARVNGSVQAPVVTGRTLTWTLPSLNGLVTLVYATSIGVGAPPQTTLSNLVSANALPAGAAGPPASGSARAAVIVVGTTFGSCYPITGRVYDDAKKSAHFEAGDRGLSGVRIVLDDGESVLTDAYGRYSFPCVRPGMHALRVDEASLPAGSAAYADRALDSERSTRRLVHSTFDATILQDVNFAIGP